MGSSISPALSQVHFLNAYHTVFLWPRWWWWSTQRSLLLDFVIFAGGGFWGFFLRSLLLFFVLGLGFRVSWVRDKGLENRFYFCFMCFHHHDSWKWNPIFIGWISRLLDSLISFLKRVSRFIQETMKLLEFGNSGDQLLNCWSGIRFVMGFHHRT
jgi:hypothetical protein